MFASPLLALALAPHATAADIKIPNIRTRQTADGVGLVVIVKHDDNDEVANVAASYEAGGVGETVPLVAEGAWLHGSVALAALPETGATVTFTAYDAGSKPIASFSKAAGSTLYMKRADYCGTGDSYARCRGDLYLRAANPFAGSAGYALGLDLAGFDAAEVAYGQLDVSTTVESCSARGVCTSSTKTVSYTVDWDDAGTVYAGLNPFLVEAATDLTVEATDAGGGRLELVTTEVVAPWDDGGAGVGALPADEDPLTSLALYGGVKELADILENQYHTVVTSDGWERGDTLPTYAEVTLDGGEVWTIPANSYQVAAATPITFKGDPAEEAFLVTVNGTAMKAGTPVGRRGMCQYGACFCLSQEPDGSWTLAATAYAADPADLPGSVKVTLTGTLGKATPTAASYSLAYDDEVAVVFAADTDVVGDPDALDLTGKLRLRGRQTLFVGHFAGQITTDEDGDVGLAAIPHGGPVDSRGDILIGGEPIGFELTKDTDGDGTISGPPAIVLKNGSGTRKVATSSGQTTSQLL